MANNRIDKINSELKRAIAKVINSKFVDKFDNALISVTEAKTTLNLEFCDVYISILAVNEEKTQEILKQISQSLTEIRSEVAKIINLRAMPRLNLHIDRSEEYSQHINKLLKDIKNNAEGKIE